MFRPRPRRKPRAIWPNAARPTAAALGILALSCGRADLHRDDERMGTATNVSTSETSATTTGAGVTTSVGPTASGEGGTSAGTMNAGAGGTASVGAGGTWGTEPLPTPPSCDGETSLCQGESCCTSLPIPGGTFWMGEATTANWAGQQVTVGAYALDKYEVTVGRFRRFVEGYDGTVPAAGVGAHARIAGSGWQSSWNRFLPRDAAALRAELKCNDSFATWTDADAANEDRAVNCVSWFTAMAFCIWDGAYLPTEAEWEYAAAAGSERRLFPWGAAVPTTALASHHCLGVGTTSCEFADILPVGSAPAGAGLWGQADLAGGMWEWTLDWYAPYFQSGVTDPAVLEPGAYRVLRGGSWQSVPVNLYAALRVANSPGDRLGSLGFRCARSR